MYPATTVQSHSRITKKTVPEIANQEDPYDYYDEIKETVDRIDYDLLYGGDNEDDNTAYDDYDTFTEDDYNTDDYNTNDYNTESNNDYGGYNEDVEDDYNDYNYDTDDFTTEETNINRLSRGRRSSYYWIR